MQRAQLTEAEKQYYKMYVEMTTMFSNHLHNKIGSDGQRILQSKRDKLYIPNRSGGRMETILARNMTAAFR